MADIVDIADYGGGAAAGGSGKVPILSLAELAEQSKNVSWLVKHALPADALGLIYGAPETFKSFIALDMALHVAHGMPWLGKKTRKGAVLFVAGEGGAGLWRRILAWHRKHRLQWTDIAVYVLPVAMDLAIDSPRVQQAVAELGVVPSLVVIDTLSQTFGGEENSATEVAAYFRELGLWFRAAWQATVLVVHHTGYSAAERPRGSSALRGNVDFMYGVFRDEKEMLATLENPRQKDGELLKPVTFAMHVVELDPDEDGDPVTSLVATALNERGQVVDLMRHEAERGRGGHNSRFLELAFNGIEEKQLRTIFYESMDGAPDAKKQAYHRSRSWALKAGLIEVAQGYVLRIGG